MQEFDPGLVANPNFVDKGFIRSKGQLFKEILSGGGIQLFHDAAGIGKDFVKGVGEIRDLRRDPVFDGIGVPHGDKSPVFVLGGFFSSQMHYFDFTTGLYHANYDARTLPWGNSNVLAPFKMADYMMPEIERLKKETGRRAKMVVHSLGGYDTTAMMVKYPQRFVDSVEHVVYVGSPIPRKLNTALSLGYLVLHMFEDDEEFQMTDKLDDLKAVVDSGLIKFSSIDSSFDPLVSGEHMGTVDNHYVIDRASHSALGMNRHSLRAVTHAFVGEEVDSVKYPEIHHPQPALLAA